MVKCRFTKDRIIITTLGVLGFGLGLGLMIPGIIMALASPPDIDFIYSVNLCRRNETSAHEWVVRPANESCPTVYPVESMPQRIPIATNLLGGGYPYYTMIVLTDRVDAQIQYSWYSGQVDEIERTKLLSTAKNTPLYQAELEKPFDVCGGEDVRIWRDPPYVTDTSGYFPDGVEQCTEQPNGCNYQPLRSLNTYDVDHFKVEKDEWSASDEPTIQVNVADIYDPSGADLAPDLFIRIYAGSSSDNETGSILAVVGFIIADISPGIAYYLMTRLKPPRRKRA